MTEVKVNKELNKEKEALTRWPGFETPLFREMPLFRGSFFNLNPFALMRRFTEEMDRTFAGTVGRPLEEPEVWFPPVEVKRFEGKFLIYAELPGLKKEDIKVKVTNEALILEGERKEEKEEEKKGYCHTERSYGRFYREIPLPEGAQLDKVSAEFVNGLLEIAVPVPETKIKPREIPVHEGVKTKAAA
jgi:HSP20 family protein